MTQIEINGSDTTTHYLLHLDLPPEAIERFTTMAGTGEWPLKYGLGATKLRPAFVETVDLRDLGAMSLSQYLTAGYDIPAKALASEKPRIDGLRGHVVILPPQAFENTSQTLNVATPLRFVGAFSGSGAAGRGARLQSDGATGHATGGAPAPMGNLTRPVLLTLLGLAVFALLFLTLVI